MCINGADARWADTHSVRVEIPPTRRWYTPFVPYEKFVMHHLSVRSSVSGFRRADVPRSDRPFPTTAGQRFPRGHVYRTKRKSNSNYWFMHNILERVAHTARYRRVSQTTPLFQPNRSRFQTVTRPLSIENIDQKTQILKNTYYHASRYTYACIFYAINLDLLLCTNRFCPFTVTANRVRAIICPCL